MNKTCFKCKTEKPRTEFYAHPRMGDGLLGKCKECTKADVKKHREENHARICEYDRERATRPGRKARSRATALSARARDPRKHTARLMVKRAVVAGRLTPTPCVHCGDVRVQGHHRDYDRPLDVVWCCVRCHLAIEHGKRIAENHDPFKVPHYIAKRPEQSEAA